MKKAVVILVLFLFIGCKTRQKDSNEIQITSKKEVVANNYEISLDKIISDSRCPEGVNCIWAGELVVELKVWQNKQLKESKTITFSSQNEVENIEWFSKYIPANKKLLKYKISPAKTENQIELKEYKIELILE